MALHKNIASQKVLIFAWDTVARSPKTGDAGNITAYISKDGGAAVQSDDDNPTELDATDLPGIYAFDLLQAETNCDLFALKAGSSTADVEVDPVIVYTIVRDDYKADVTALALEATAQLIKTETDKIQPDIIASPDDYKANVAALALEATAQLIKTEADKIQPDIIASPGDYKADVSGLAPASEYDAELTAIQTDLDNPDQYKADVSNLDATISSRSSHSAANVWAVGTRTLTSFGTLIADIWGYVTRILTAGTKDSEIDDIKSKTDGLNFTGTDVKATLDGESVVTDSASRTASKADVSNLDATVSSRAPASEYDTEMARITADVATEAKQDVIDTVVDGIKAKTDTISWADITFLKDIEGGRWRIVSNQMIFYKSDNSTEVARFNLLDSAGSASMENVFERQRV